MFVRALSPVAPAEAEGREPGLKRPGSAAASLRDWVRFRQNGATKLPLRFDRAVISLSHHVLPAARRESRDLFHDTIAETDGSRVSFPRLKRPGSRRQWRTTVERARAEAAPVVCLGVGSRPSLLLSFRPQAEGGWRAARRVVRISPDGPYQRAGPITPGPEHDLRGGARDFRRATRYLSAFALSVAGRVGPSPVRCSGDRPGTRLRISPAGTASRPTIMNAS